MALRFEKIIKYVNIAEIFHEIFHRQKYRILYISRLVVYLVAAACVWVWTYGRLFRTFFCVFYHLEQR